MKLCLSTLGCPDWSLGEILTVAKDLGVQGLEIRGLQENLYAPVLPLFSPQQAPDTLRRIRETGLEIAILTSGAALATGGENAYGEACAYIDLAERLGVPYIRVMAEPTPEPSDINLLASARRYAQLCDYAKGSGVLPLVETNGQLANSVEMLAFLSEAGRENMGVVWDIHHPWRYYGETPKTTLSRLAGYVKHCHIKDSLMENGQVHYKLMGYGDVPAREALSLLKKSGYAGHVSLEWTKRWNPSLEEPGLVFVHFASYCKNLLAQLETPEPDPI